LSNFRKQEWRKAAKDQIMQRFYYNYDGQLNEYVGCNVKQTNRSIKFIQLVLLQI